MQQKRLTASLVAVALFLVGSLAGATSAQAYPAGQNLSLNLDQTTVLISGTTIHGNVTHVYPGCVVTVKISGSSEVSSSSSSSSSSSGTTLTFTAGQNGTVPTFDLKTPVKYGYYTVRASTSSSCAGGAEVSTVSLTVGYVTTLTASLSTSSTKVSAKPSLSVTGTLKYGATALKGLAVTAVVVKPNSTRSATYRSTTKANGSYSINIPRVATLAGAYVAVVTFAGSTKYLPSSRTTNSVTLTLR